MECGEIWKNIYIYNILKKEKSMHYFVLGEKYFM